MKLDALVYCENEFGKIDGKTANGLVRKSDKYNIVGIIDSSKEGLDAGEYLDGKINEIPIFKSIDHALENLNNVPNYFIYGIAPLIPFLNKKQKEVIFLAMKRGMNIINGLPEYFNDNPLYTDIAVKYGVTIQDVRKPPKLKKLHGFTGEIRDIKTPVVLIQGTDCAVGKRTTSLLLVDALKKKGIKAVFVATGQTGLLQGAKYGIAVDVLTSGYATGEVENAILKAYKKEKPDIIIVEGQGALGHPAFTSSAAILRGAMPDAVILQHSPHRNRYSDYLNIPILSLEKEIEMIQIFSTSEVIAITINHEYMTNVELKRTIENYELEYDIPTTDVLKHGCDKLKKALFKKFPKLRKEVESDWSFPRVDIDLRKISHNVRSLKKLYGSKKLEIIGVTKLICGDPVLASVLVENGIKTLADSRIANIKRMKESGIKAEFMLLRSPAWSEINEVIRNVDISLNTEIIILKQLSKVAIENNIIHKVILMIEMGDLREGIMPFEIDAIVKEVIKLKGLFLIGIGTNLACFSGEIPNAKKMNELSLIVSNLERKFNINLEIISGGNSANYYWFMSSKNIGRINSLRIGESFFLGTEPIMCNSISNLYTDAFVLVVEVIESKMKPNKKTLTKRIIVAIGEQDVLVSGISPTQNVVIIGASSDHLVLSCDNCNLNIGDILSFNLNYKALLRVFNSKYVIKNIIN